MGEFLLSNRLRGVENRKDTTSSPVSELWMYDSGYGQQQLAHQDYGEFLPAQRKE